MKDKGYQIVTAALLLLVLAVAVIILSCGADTSSGTAEAEPPSPQGEGFERKEVKPEPAETEEPEYINENVENVNVNVNVDAEEDPAEEIIVKNEELIVNETEPVVKNEEEETDVPDNNTDVPDDNFESLKNPGKYSSINITETDMELLAKIVYLEARGESFEGQQAVVEVIFNRVLDPRYPDTIEGVIFDTKYGVQFTSSLTLNEACPTETQYQAISAAIKGPGVIDDAIFFSTKGENENIVKIIGGHVFCR